MELTFEIMAEKPSSTASDRAAELVTCSICLGNIKDARALPCVHTFCKECLQRLVTPRGNLTCPHCRKIFPVPNGDASNLNPNFYVNNIIDMFNLEKGNGNTTENVDEACSVPFCTDHPEKECEFFCLDCSKFICSECKSSWSVCSCFHQLHGHMTIDKAAKVSRGCIKGLLQQKQEFLVAADKRLADLAEMRAKEKARALGVSREISASFTKHMNSLKNRQEAMMRKASELQKKNDDVVSSEVNQVQLKQAKSKSVIEFCRETENIEDLVLFLHKYAAINDQFQADMKLGTSAVELDEFRFNAAEDSLLNGAISNFGRVVSRDELDVVKKECGPFAPRRPQSKRSRRRANRQPYVTFKDPEPPRPDVRPPPPPTRNEIVLWVIVLVSVFIFSIILSGTKR